MHSGQESFARPRWRELPGGPRAPVFMARLRAAARQALCSLAGGHEPQEVSMARILVLYGTTEGHTARVADSIGATLRAHGDMADVVQASRPGPSPEDSSGIVVAASVHGGRDHGPSPPRHRLASHDDEDRCRSAVVHPVRLAQAVADEAHRRQSPW